MRAGWEYKHNNVCYLWGEQNNGCGLFQELDGLWCANVVSNGIVYLLSGYDTVDKAMITAEQEYEFLRRQNETGL